jgi:hypothetical protein
MYVIKKLIRKMNLFDRMFYLKFKNFISVFFFINQYKLNCKILIKFKVVYDKLYIE